MLNKQVLCYYYNLNKSNLFLVSLRSIVLFFQVTDRLFQCASLRIYLEVTF